MNDRGRARRAHPARSCAAQPNRASTSGGSAIRLRRTLFETILRQPIVLLEVVVAEDLAALRSVPVVAHQAPVGDDTGGRHLGRQQALRAHLVDAAPEIEVLERALCQVLALWDVVHPDPPLDQRA